VDVFPPIIYSMRSERNVFAGHWLRFRFVECWLAVAANHLAVAKDCALGSRCTGFLGYALDYSVVVPVLILWRLKEHYVKVGAFGPLVEQCLVNFRYVDFYCNHVSLLMMMFA